MACRRGCGVVLHVQIGLDDTCLFNATSDDGAAMIPFSVQMLKYCHNTGNSLMSGATVNATFRATRKDGVDQDSLCAHETRKCRVHFTALDWSALFIQRFVS